ncbi:MAG: hypothetical protein IT367_11810 [Candidatus Hydrogenedentes bacterium]|nr:hypothetical protein [Candidatus Hydrogenedentota bacterium]
MADAQSKPSDAAKGGSHSRLSQGLLFLGVFAALGAIAFTTALGVYLAQSDVASIRGEEQHFVTGIRAIMDGLPVYEAPNKYPHMLWGYMPMFYYLTAWCVAPAKASADPLLTIMQLGRTLALALTLFHLALFLWLVWRYFRIKLAFALIACGIIFAIRAPWGFVVRPDPLFSFWFILAIVFVLPSLDKQRTGRYAMVYAAFAGIASSALFLTKQTGIQIPVIALSFYFLKTNWKNFAAYASAFALPLGVAFLSFPYVLGDDWAGSMFLTNSNGVNIGNGWRKCLYPVLFRNGGLVLLAAAIPAWLAWRKRNTDPRLQFLAWATIGALGFSAMTAFMSGSAEHYFNDSMTLVLACLAVYWGGLKDRSATQSQWIAGACGAYSAVFLPVFLLYCAQPYLNMTDRLTSRKEVRAELQRRLEQHPDAAFLTVDNALANYFPGRAVVPQFFYTGYFVNNQAVDVTSLQPYLDDGRVRWCVFGEDQDLARQLGFLRLSAPHFKKVLARDGFAFWEFQDPTQASVEPPQVD